MKKRMKQLDNQALGQQLLLNLVTCLSLLGKIRIKCG